MLMMAALRRTSDMVVSSINFQQSFSAVLRSLLSKKKPTATVSL